MNDTLREDLCGLLSERGEMTISQMIAEVFPDTDNYERDRSRVYQALTWLHKWGYVEKSKRYPGEELRWWYVRGGHRLRL